MDGASSAPVHTINRRNITKRMLSCDEVVMCNQKLGGESPLLDELREIHESSTPPEPAPSGIMQKEAGNLGRKVRRKVEKL